MSNLTWKKYHPLTDQNAFICLVDYMGDDNSIVQAARVSYGKDKQEYEIAACKLCNGTGVRRGGPGNDEFTCICITEQSKESNIKDRQLIRYLLNHGHTTPFEMVEIKFMVQVPMDCWRQWIRHRTASVNEYSTRYTEALDFFQVTSPQEWRLQATDNKQGSSGYVDTYAEYVDPLTRASFSSPGGMLSAMEEVFHERARKLYKERLDFGVAKEQARKDLPLSTYTRAYWKCDLHNIFNFLRLRMDSHAQLEIRSFANCMFEIVKQLCPVACEAFEDYVLNAKKFSRMEMKVLKDAIGRTYGEFDIFKEQNSKPDSMTDREWKEFLAKLS